MSHLHTDGGSNDDNGYGDGPDHGTNHNPSADLMDWRESFDSDDGHDDNPDNFEDDMRAFDSTGDDENPQPLSHRESRLGRSVPILGTTTVAGGGGLPTPGMGWQMAGEEEAESLDFIRHCLEYEPEKRPDPDDVMRAIRQNTAPGKTANSVVSKADSYTPGTDPRVWDPPEGSEAVRDPLDEVNELDELAPGAGDASGADQAVR
ncbi:hypothetical protein DOTSEDRAFT_52015 [Dothistroma septosporum NZE10]|uniref:Uncharacterized protein n=1 Tax=Dothistroma septosporum (strain NZE10 / CBS 128990) TaxID=675120 RepID=N1PUE6_DOTSN|nr:hypothetical protein DOTSEDRAFT_52015 [Dothistroma septosporum NZE10]